MVKLPPSQGGDVSSILIQTTVTIVQMAERQLVALNVEGSSPSSHLAIFLLTLLLGLLTY